jgi:hypothetical protein
MKRLSLFLLVFAAIGCGDSGPKVRLTEAAPAAVPAGWKSLASADATVSIAVPTDWKMWTDASEMMSSLGGSLGEVMGTPPPTNPTDTAAGMGDTAANLADQFNKDLAAQEKEEMERWAAEGILIKAKDSSRAVAGETPTSVVIKKAEAKGNPTMEQALETAASAFVAGDIKKEIIDLPIGKAAMASSSYETRGGDQVKEVIYILLDNGQEYKIRFITVNTGVPIFERAKEMMETLRIKPQA